ncbi:UNVERIFIED_CONTAM: hypothetical protein FKN15_030161 [Acipenser sinensis]
MARRVWSCFSSISTAVLYGSLSLFVSILHNVFLLYYVDTFVSVYKIDKVSFWVGETVFLIWNSLNDPLFGWISDRSFLGSQHAGVRISNPQVVLKRLQALSRTGPLFVLSFLAFWVSWARPGLQFLVCLCLYDGFLTMVDLNHNALLADLAVSASERTRLNFQCSLFSALGSLSVFMSYSFWDKEDFFSFRMFCVALAALSILGFSVACWLLQHRFQGRARRDEEEDSVLKELCVGQAPLAQEKELTLGQYLKQLSKHTNFLWFASMNLVQQFLPTVPGASPFRPNLSLHRILSARNRVFTEGTCKLLNLVISDLVDEDLVMNHRQQAASALLFGMVALTEVELNPADCVVGAVVQIGSLSLTLEAGCIKLKEQHRGVVI